LLSSIINSETEDYDLKDRANFYCKLLQNNPKDLKNLLNERIDMTDNFVEDEEMLQEGATLEFNTLSVIYQKPAEKFVKSIAYMNSLRNKELAETIGQVPEQQAPQETPKEETPKDIQIPQKSDLLDLMGGQDQSANGNIGQQVLDVFGGSPSIVITKNDIAAEADIDPDYFQNQWGTLPDAAKLTRVLSNLKPNVTEKEIEDMFHTMNVFCIASGEQDNEMKFFFYGKYLQTGSFVFMELNINKSNSELNLIIKTETEDIAPWFTKYIENCLISWGML